MSAEQEELDRRYKKYQEAIEEAEAQAVVAHDELVGYLTDNGYVVQGAEIYQPRVVGKLIREQVNG